MSPLLKTTNASFSFVIVHVGATLHAQEITFSWKSVQPNNRPIRDDRYLNNGFTVNPTRAKTCCREGMKGRSKRNGEFSLVCRLSVPPPLPLLYVIRFSIAYAHHVSRRLSIHIILAGLGAGRTLLIIEPRPVPGRGARLIIPTYTRVLLSGYAL